MHTVSYHIRKISKEVMKGNCQCVGEGILTVPSEYVFINIFSSYSKLSESNCSSSRMDRIEKKVGTVHDKESNQMVNPIKRSF